MRYLMHIGFDNNARLWKNVFYLEYKCFRFKLIQNNNTERNDVLLTILPNGNNTAEVNNAYIAASEFISALSWEHNSSAKVYPVGGVWQGKKITLKNAKPSLRTFRKIPFCGYSIGHEICCIPEIENEEQRNALILFREASSSNNDYLAFLFFWQILDIGRNDPIGWVNKAYRKNRNKIRLSNDAFKKLPLNGKSLGNYFYDDCRNAIAHIFKLYEEKRKLKLDTIEEDRRIIWSTRVIKEFAMFYIRDKLKLNKSMYLVRKNGTGFPGFVSEDKISKIKCEIAYQKPHL